MRRMRTLLVLGCSLAMVTAAQSARADDDGDDEPKNAWVDRPLVLKSMPPHASFDAGIATAGVPVAGGTRGGPGANIEGTVSLPFLGEVTLRTGYRFNEGARLAGSDYYARLFDHETANLGGDPWANPEIRLRGAFVDLDVFAIGLETRFVVPLADGSDFTAAPGAPIRIRIPHLARIDTGIFVPFEFSKETQYTFSIPAQLWFQVEDFFFGPMTGVRFNHLATVDPISGVTVTSSRTDIPAGLGAGYTLGGHLDIKAQLYTMRINDADWTKLMGVGLGVGVLVP